MSTEAAVVPVPADDQPIVEKVHEQTHEVKESDSSPPPKPDEKKDAKEDLAAEKLCWFRGPTTKVEKHQWINENQTGTPVVVEAEKVDDVPAEVVSEEIESSDKEPEQSSTKESASETVEAVENVPVGKPAAESVEDNPVEKIESEAVEKEAEKAEAVEANEKSASEKSRSS
ncbi:hypothetical protein ACFXTN_020056 [Malus domestica]